MVEQGHAPESHGRKVVTAALRNRAIVIRPWIGVPVWWLQRFAPAAPVMLGSGLARVSALVRPVAERITERR